MIETEEQRRWWFATHPEYSWSRRGIRTHAYKEKDKDSEKVAPEEVDAYVDEMLNYATGPVADLLKSAKRNFGTESLHPDHDSHSRKPAIDGRTHDLTKLHEALERDKEGLIQDPHTLLDLLPYRRLATAPLSVLKAALKNLAGNAVLNATKKVGKRWKVGDSTLASTSKGVEPSWTTQYRRYWKNEAAREGAIDKWGENNIDRMKRGLAPRRFNRKHGEPESKELHHHPEPRREGGKEVVDLWPDEHSAVDPYRRTKKR